MDIDLFSFLIGVAGAYALVFLVLPVVLDWWESRAASHNAQVQRQAERSEDCPLEPLVGPGDEP